MGMTVDVEVAGGGQELVKEQSGLLKTKNQTDCATGCGAYIIFRRQVKSYTGIYECTDNSGFTFALDVGARVAVDAMQTDVREQNAMPYIYNLDPEELKGHCELTLGAKFGFNSSHTERHFREITHIIDDKVLVSHCY